PLMHRTLYIQVLAAIARGIAVRLPLPERRRCPQTARRRLHRADQDDDRAGDLLHCRAWDRRHGRPLDGRPHRLGDSDLFRGNVGPHWEISMSPEQVKLIKSSFASVLPITEETCKLFYERLFALDPALRPWFKGDIAEQSRCLMRMIAVAVSSL